MNSANIYTNQGFVMSAAKASHEEFHRRLRRLYPCVDDVSHLPHGWSPKSKAQQLGLTEDKLGCYYKICGRKDEDEKNAADVRTDNSIPPSCLLYYYEIKFISKGREGFMGLGLTSNTAVTSKLPGWMRESYGYHADDGNIFNGEGRGHQYGPTFTSGDIIGCGYNLVEGRCFFTKNGLNLGKAFDDIPTDYSFYPTVGLKTFGEEIVANFGQEEFAYDIEQDLRSLRKNMTLTISNYPIDDFGNWQSTLHKLVQLWLLQNSYPDTAEAFSRSAKMECKENMQRIQFRNRIQQYVLNGKISEAIKLTNRLWPDLLQNNPNLLFALKCRQFVELINGAESDFQLSTCSETDNSEISKFNINSGNNNNGTSNNGVSRLDVNGDQPMNPPKPSNTNTSTGSTTNSTSPSNYATINTSNNSSSSNNNNNGCNGMIGDNNCEKVGDQLSTSSSSYQELMDVDQNLVTANNSSNMNDAINNHHQNNNHNNNQHQRNHRPQLGLNNSLQSNDPSSMPVPNEPSFGNMDAVPGDVSLAQQATTMITNDVDTDLDFNEQKFAKLISFGQELYDHLHQLDKLYGKNETNERMLEDAIGLIAFVDPQKSQHGKLLDPKEREPISQILNSSILKAETGDSCRPPIEDVVSKLRDLVRQNNSRGRWLVDQLY